MEEFHRRCNDCNKVSSQEIETNIGDFSQDHFVIDPHNSTKFICKECKEWYEELMMDYEIKDDPYGWKEDGLLDILDLELETESDNDEDIRDDKKFI